MQQKNDHKQSDSKSQTSNVEEQKNENRESKPDTHSDDSLITKLQQELDQAQQAQTNAVAQSQRALADYANLKKRFDKERQDLAKFAAESVVVQLLPSLDNLERALQYTSPDEQKGGLFQGVKMTLQHIDDTLKGIGFSRIDVQPGQPFNPEQHEAVEMVEGDKEKIIEIVASGYTLHDKVIRPTQVKVGQG